MMIKDLKKHIAGAYILLDGATGTNLQCAGLTGGVCPEAWALEHPDVLLGLQRAYVKAGSQSVYAFTFGANRIKLGEYGLGEKTADINKRLVELSRKAAGDFALVGGDIGPTGLFVEPFGDMPFEEAVSVFYEQAAALAEAGADFISIETFIDIQEARAALIAAREATKLPIFACMTFEGGKTLTGTDAATALVTLQSLGACAVGCNCSTGPKEMVEAIRAMKPYARVPIIAKPNAGLPRLRKGRLWFDTLPDEFAESAKALIEAGASIIGGCCGTTPEYISKLAEILPKSAPSINGDASGVLTSAHSLVETGPGKKTVLIGERINPTGKKRLQQELREGNTDYVVALAVEQAADGADMLDVNVGTSGVDDAALMRKLVPLVAAKTDLPLCIDSVSPEAVEAALRVYPGRALLNSISGEEEKLEKLLPLAQKYGAMFVALPLDGSGVPETAKERIGIAKKIIARANAAGIPNGDIVVDGLTLTIATSETAAIEALKTVEWAGEQGCGSVLGVSNISFGLPERQHINAAFLTLAMQKGLTLAIANPSAEGLRPAMMAANALLRGSDAVNLYVSTVTKTAETPPQTLYEAVVSGRKELAGPLAEELYKSGGAEAVIERSVVPALEEVGRRFEEKKYFLPQLVQSAEAAKAAFAVIERAQGEVRKTRGKIVLATVKGDLHDIGKNIVALMLRNHGFTVIDLGKNVPAEDIVEAIVREKAPLCGLSALLTTTMEQMPVVISMIRERGIDCRVMVGGAVVTEQYAKEIGADGYSKDAMEAVKLAARLTES